MPIYAYRCGACGHAKDVLQKISDPVLTTCPACGAEAYSKQVTAAGFQLKGSGWYVTDFRGGNNAAAKKDDSEGMGKEGDKAGAGEAAPSDGAGSDAKPAKAGEATAAAPKSETPAKSGGSAASAAPAPAAPAGGTI